LNNEANDTDIALKYLINGLSGSMADFGESAIHYKLNHNIVLKNAIPKMQSETKE